MDSGYFDDDIIEAVESAGYHYLIMGKEYPTIASQVTDPSVSFNRGDGDRETTELFMKLDAWDKDRRFVVSRVLKPGKNRVQLSFLEGDNFETFYFVTNTEMASEKVVITYENAAMLKNISRKQSMIWLLDICYSNLFGTTKPSFNL